MNREEALQIFTKGLNNLTGIEGEPIINLVWFVEDFDYFTQDYLKEIFFRISNPPYLENLKGPQPIFPLVRLAFTLLDVPTMNKSLIYNQVPEMIHSAIRHKDPKTYEHIRWMFQYWVSQQLLSRDHFMLIRTAFESEQNLPWLNKQEEEIIKEEQNTSDDIEEPQPPQKKKLAMRPWMIPATQWERGGQPEETGTTIEEAPKVDRVIKYIKVTPENENATCSVCGGRFKTENNKYGLVFVGVEKIKGSGYVHTACKSHISGFLF